MRDRPVIIPILWFAGVLALLSAVGLCSYAVFASAEVAFGALALGAGAAVTGLFLFGFAANLVVLADIRRDIAKLRDR